MLNGDCHQVCNNFDGGFSCSCNEGFELTSDNRTCQGRIICSLFSVFTLSKFENDNHKHPLMNSFYSSA